MRRSRFFEASAHGGADAVRTKDHRGTCRNVVDGFDEGDALSDKAGHDVFVVNNGVVDVKRGADEVNEFLHGVDGHVYAGTEAAGVGEDDLHEGGSLGLRAWVWDLP